MIKVLTRAEGNTLALTDYSAWENAFRYERFFEHRVSIRKFADVILGPSASSEPALSLSKG